MSLADKLRLYLADKNASWNGSAATWTEEGRSQIAIAIDGPLTAQTLIDAHVRALDTRAKVTLAHTGAPTTVALRTAARFGITLLDASALPESPAPDLEATPPPAEILQATTLPELPTLPQLPTIPAPETQIIAHSESAPEIVHANDPLPWDLSLSTPEPEPVHVEASELLLMPWHASADDQHEIVPAGRSARHAPARPTTVAHDWGLPWPRPVTPTDGLAIADPKLWHNPERIQAVREDLDRAGAPSFGVTKPQGSNWLKHITEFG